MLRTVTSINELRLAIASWLRHNETIGFVPTMGSLHEGHLELVRKSQSLATHTIVSIFVNQLQFASPEAVENYPRPVSSDQEKLESVGCDLLFMPSSDEIYPDGFATKVDPGAMGNILEGARRPGLFTGIATVVTRLLMLVSPDYACFGEKDYQQLQVIKQIARDLSITAQIVPVPTVRDSDGLPLSSRNAGLTTAERELAGLLPKVLFDCANRMRAGEDVASVLERGRLALTQGRFRVDYLTLVDGKTLAPLSAPQNNARLLVAAVLGTTRLLDNTPIFGTPEQDLLLI